VHRQLLTGPRAASASGRCCVPQELRGGHRWYAFCGPQFVFLASCLFTFGYEAVGYVEVSTLGGGCLRLLSLLKLSPRLRLLLCTLEVVGIVEDFVAMEFEYCLSPPCLSLLPSLNLASS
jgi:hypothetical protein